MTCKPSQFKGLRVTVMGLGLHGGGLASAKFFLQAGAIVTVTDLKPPESLKTSIEQLNNVGHNIRYVLGEHREKDFLDTDMVIKNPGVSNDSPFLRIAKKAGIPIETDISIFLKCSQNPIIAVTGSKGKSTTAAAIHWCLKKVRPKAKLGGNITVSPLTFLNEIIRDNLKEETPVVLELSSWQLADLRDSKLLKPKISIVTNILPDHQNKYHSMDEYVEDKKVIVANQSETDSAILNLQDPYRKEFSSATRAKIFFFSNHPFPYDSISGGYLDKEKAYLKLHRELTPVFRETRLKGKHNRLNLLAAAIALKLYGVELDLIGETLTVFPGLEHRMEIFFEKNGIKFYNDSAATIPEATAEAVKSLEKPLILITGGTDKKLDFSPFTSIIAKPEMIFLLDGSATYKIESLLTERGIDYRGPFENLEILLENLKREIRKMESERKLSVIFSPGSASFELFDNEFHRGKVFKQLVESIMI